MTTEPVRAGPDWLTLREPADAAARSPALVDALRSRLQARRPLVVHDLGCGSGSMGRWLAPLLPGPQHWVLHDRDDDLLAAAARHPPAGASDGAAVTVETRHGDITRLGRLVGADLVTASALLDMLTADELGRLLDTCVAARCPVLVTLSVVGCVALTPPEPFDDLVAGSFNNHQRRDRGMGRLLGPDAFAHAVDRLAARGLDVLVQDSPWRLGPDQAALAARWFEGWVEAACHQRPALRGPAGGYRRRRLAEIADGRLGVTVEHADLLAAP